MRDGQFLLKTVKKVAMKRPILIEGLPGIGNVGKIAADFIIESTKAKKLYEIHSELFPSYAYVNHQDILELPRMEIYHKKKNGKDILFLSGDVQPTDDKACFEFCQHLVEMLKKHKTKEIITLGGIGLLEQPKETNLYYAGTDEKILRKYKSKSVKTGTTGIMGPIVGMTGLLPTISKEHGISGITLLAETSAHPNQLGVKAAREIIKYLNDKLKLGISMKALDREVQLVEKEIKEKLEMLPQEDYPPVPHQKEEVTNYIG